MKAVKEILQMRGHSRHVGCSTTPGYALKMEQCFAIFVANRRRQIHLDQQAIQITGSGHDQLLRAGRKRIIQFTEKDKKRHATLQCNFLIAISLNV